MAPAVVDLVRVDVPLVGMPAIVAAAGVDLLVAAAVVVHGIAAAPLARAVVVVVVPRVSLVPRRVDLVAVVVAVVGVLVVVDAAAALVDVQTPGGDCGDERGGGEDGGEELHDCEIGRWNLGDGSVKYPDGPADEAEGSLVAD